MTAPEPWWTDGLAFECHGCGACCRGAGNVWISDAEIAHLARALELSEDELRVAYTRPAGPRRRRNRQPDRDTVLRQKRNQDCVFWQAGTGCQIYEHRPRQCRTYPFWRANLQARESWDTEARACRGIGAGTVHDRGEITALMGDDGIPSHRSRLRASVEEASEEALEQALERGPGEN